MELNTIVARNAMGVAKKAIKTGDWVYLKKDPSKTTLVVDEVRASGHFRVTDIPGAWFTEKDVEVVKKSANAAPIAANAWMPMGVTALRVAHDVDGRPIKVGDKVTATAGASFKEDVIASIFKDGDKGIFVTLKGSPQAVRDPRTEIMKNSCALKTKVARNAVAACNDKWIVRKSLSTSKWLLSSKTSSMGDMGTTKVFATEQEARDYAKKNGLVVVNAKFKVGDRVQLKGGNRTGKVVGGLGAYDKDSHPDCVTVRWDSYGFDVPVKPENLTVANSTPVANAKFKVGDRVEFNIIHGFTPVKKTGKIRFIDDHDPSGEKSVGDWYYIDVDGGGRAATQYVLRTVNSACSLTSKVARNAVGLNDKWIDDFHAILTEDKPDPALVEALKKKAAALKAVKRSPADNEAKSTLYKAEEEAMAIAKRLGAKWIQHGAVTKIVMPDYTKNPTTMNAVAKNWNYKNNYQFFCVDPSLAKPCIHSGWDYKEDAKEDAQELKELKIPYKIVSRRFLEQSGVDPNSGDWWKKGR